MRVLRGLACRAVAVAMVALVVGPAAAGAGLRVGGSLELTGTGVPAASGAASLEAFVGLGSVEASTLAQYSIFPYTTGFDSLALYLVREWLSAGAEYEFSLLPLGITSARAVFAALPPPWLFASGDTMVELSIAAEARLIGYTFFDPPQRTEVWMRMAINASRSLGWIDQALLGASLEATLSAPGDGRIWPASTLLAELSLGSAYLRSETTISLLPALRFDGEKIILGAAWSDLGIKAEAELGLAAGPEPITLGLRFGYEFGDVRLYQAASEESCAGGVCR